MKIDFSGINWYSFINIEIIQISVCFSIIIFQPVGSENRRFFFDLLCVTDDFSGVQCTLDRCANYRGHTHTHTHMLMISSSPVFPSLSFKLFYHSHDPSAQVPDYMHVCQNVCVLGNCRKCCSNQVKQHTQQCCNRGLSLYYLYFRFIQPWNIWRGRNSEIGFCWLPQWPLCYVIIVTRVPIWWTWMSTITPWSRPGTHLGNSIKLKLSVTTLLAFPSYLNSQQRCQTLREKNLFDQYWKASKHLKSIT